MTTTESKNAVREVEINAIGLSKNVWRSFAEALEHLKVRRTAGNYFDIMLQRANETSLVLLEIKSSEPLLLRNLELLRQFSSFSPIVYLSDARQTPADMHIAQWMSELLGACVYTGSRGKSSIVTLLHDISGREPSEILTNVRISDGGLKVTFADHSTALIPLPEVSRLAESNSLRWDSIRISPDRSHITLRTISNEEVPIPGDVLAEYSSIGRESRLSKIRREKELTAKAFGAKLRSLRETSGITQESLAQQIKRSRATIIRIENGERLPKISDIERIARVLKSDVSELIGEG